MKVTLKMDMKQVYMNRSGCMASRSLITVSFNTLLLFETVNILLFETVNILLFETVNIVLLTVSDVGMCFYEK
jgi:hypothetical protein